MSRVGVGFSEPAPASLQRVRAPMRYNPLSMRVARLRLAVVLTASVFVASCGGSSAAESSTPTIAPGAIPTATGASTKALLDWPEFGLDPQRSDVSEAA